MDRSLLPVRNRTVSDGSAELLMHQIAVSPVPKRLVDQLARKLARLIRRTRNDTLHRGLNLVAQHITHCQIRRVLLGQVIQPLNHDAEILPRVIPIRFIAALKVTFWPATFFRWAGSGTASANGIGPLRISSIETLDTDLMHPTITHIVRV